MYGCKLTCLTLFNPLLLQYCCNLFIETTLRFYISLSICFKDSNCLSYLIFYNCNSARVPFLLTSFVCFSSGFSSPMKVGKEQSTNTRILFLKFKIVNTSQKMKFLQETAGLITFIGEIYNGKPHFCTAKTLLFRYFQNKSLLTFSSREILLGDKISFVFVIYCFSKFLFCSFCKLACFLTFRYIYLQKL